MPYAEPNSVPEVFSDPAEWRAAYVECVEDYRKSKRGPADELSLELGLKRLGYSGSLLQNELTHVRIDF